MGIQAYSELAGYNNCDQMARRLVWTCGALTLGNVIAPLFFRNFSVKTHVFFGLVEGSTFQLIFHNSYFRGIRNKLEEIDPERVKTMTEMGRIVQFVLLTSTPLFLAKRLTSRFFEEISRTHMIKMGVLYNGGVAIASAYGYEYWDKTLRGS